MYLLLQYYINNDEINFHIFNNSDDIKELEKDIESFKKNFSYLEVYLLEWSKNYKAFFNNLKEHEDRVVFQIIYENDINKIQDILNEYNKKEC